jgi:hypothetical protein
MIKLNPISDTSRKACEPGSYLSDPTPWIDNSAVCKECPPGFYSSSIDAFECTECPTGYYCPPRLGHSGSSGAKSCPYGCVCPAGSVCPSGSVCPYNKTNC